jgi:acyl-CoA synthetase (AMP-forming)/AMP-acid ligase II
MLNEGLWRSETWGDCLLGNVDRFGTQMCVIDAFNKASFMQSPMRRLDWESFELAVDNCAESLFLRGVRSGQVVGVQMPNCAELMVTYLAINRLGAIVSPYPVAYRRHEIATLSRIGSAEFFITTDDCLKRDLVSDLTTVAEDRGLSGGVLRWNAGGDDGPSIISDAAVFSGKRPTDTAYREYVEALEVDINDCVLIMFTSGTTGDPKGVPRAHGDSLFNGVSNTIHPSLTDQSVILNPLPMVNAGGIGGIMMPWLVSGACLVQHDPFDLEIFLQQVEQERVTYSIVAPATLNDLAKDVALYEKYDLSSFKTVGAGSAPLSGWAIEVWEDRFGVEVINFFGATEGVQLTADCDTVPEPSERGRYVPVPRSTGFKWRQDIHRQPRIRLVDLDSERDVEREGQPGELRFWSPGLFSGYLHGVGEPFDEMGYFRTGDLFEYRTADLDMLFHVDRSKDLIIRGGLNISAAELETVLISHPKIAEVAAVGKKDERLGERTCIFVVPVAVQEPPLLDEITEFLESCQVAKFKFPEFLEVVEQLPKNPMGKVLKRQLRLVLNGSESVVG